MPILRSLLAAAGAVGFASLVTPVPAQTNETSPMNQTIKHFGGLQGGPVPSAAFPELITKQDLEALVRLHTEANQAWMVGDARRFLDILPLANDVTLMTAFGGAPSRSFDGSPERMEGLRRFFRNGTLEVETIAAYAAGDLAVLALVERSEAEIGGLPRQAWALRVTMVYRREAAGWRLVLRHADPLRGGIEVNEAAELARR